MADPASEAEAPAPRPSLPPTFHNSFWSSDYRTGYEALYDALDAGLVQSDELTAHVDARANLERTTAQGLLPPALRRDGFALDDGGSVRMAFEALLTQSVSEARARQALADDLDRTILTPFSAWSLSHAGRIRSSRAAIERALVPWERKRADVERLKATYDDACRAADLVEDEFNFVRAHGERGAQAAASDDRTAQAQQAKLPPRPDEIDDEQTPARSPASPAAGVISALGRAFSTRRPTGGASGGRAARARRNDKDGDESESGEEDGKRGAAGDGDYDDDEGKSADALREARERARKVWEERAPEVKAGLDWSRHKFTNLLSTVVGPQNVEERLEKARKEADATEERYKLAVEELDSLRLTLEETLSTHFTYSQRLEADRLRAVASVLKSFHAAIAALPKLIDGSLERVGQTLELVRPETDLKGVMERRRTGPFQPSPVMFVSHYSDPALSTFGIDLRKFDETNPDKESKPVPPVVGVLLDAIGKKGEGVEDAERRKAWLYEVPLAAQHQLRSILNSPSTLALPASELTAVVAPFDLPILCATLKLWLLELEVPVVTFSAYDELRAVYPGRTAKEGGEVTDEKVAGVLGKMPRVHFETLRAIIDHLTNLISATKTDEPLSTYVHKLSLSLSRPLLRPRIETALTLDDRFPSVFLSTLLTHSSSLFALAEEVAKKEREERYRPRRQRTKPVDQRIKRSDLTHGGAASESVDLGKAGEALKQQHRASLGLDTQALAVPTVAEGQFAASPLSATQDELPASEDTAKGDVPAEEAKAEKEVEAPIARADSPPLKKGAQAADGPTEEAFVPPGSSPTAPPPASATAAADDPQDEPALLATGSTPAAHADKDSVPLAGSTSLKRQSGTGGAGGSGRLRGARAPRPPSQVMAKVAALEGGSEGAGAGKRESWSRSKSDAPAEETE
ncbi:hypothetical protein Rhopal_005043-T1 [Rhodotorula paludigena]|uniref:Rho-GAP domain-containing protein n=1 Tax=Rhodotorula paludigena TaxID=86838 RepID=A0AAV5GHB9_9BASI|nr:hypothetical protein Rhopal_005043-T1 [Rhodotorula paludigena]